MQYRLLGPLEAVDGDRPLNLGGRKQRALLALLLLNANRVVPVEQIIDELWGECPPDTAGNAVQVHVASLRRILEPGRAGGASGTPVLVTRSPGYLISVDADSVDALRFERLVDEARQTLAHDPEGASARLRQALALRRGPTLADVVLLGPARGQVTRFEELYLAALEDRIQADLGLGRHGAVIGELGALVAAHPLRERLRAHLMLALYRCGRQAEALEQYQAARRMLSEELGIDPGTELQQLERAILHHDPTLSWRGAGAGPTPRPTTTGAGAPRHRSGSEEWLELSGPAGDRLCPLEGGRVAVGRHDGNDIVLDGDDRASRLHAVLDRVGGGWCLTDLGSSNGTYVNGVRITTGRALRQGDEVLMGTTRLVYRVRGGDRSERVTSVQDLPSIPPA